METDIQAIRDIIARQFASLNWQEGGGPDGAAFTADFHGDARLFASARPAKAQTADAFIQRMENLSSTVLRSFAERVTGAEIRVFGNVAVAVAACENIENGQDTNRNVEMLMLVKQDARWQIVAQAWDKATAELPLPDWLKS